MLQPKDTDWLNGYKNKNPYICCLQKTHFIPQDTYRLKVRGWKNIFHANGKRKKAGVAILISDKIGLKIKKIIRDKEGHYIMIKGSIQEEDITIVNIYVPNIGAPQYIRQTLTDIKGEILVLRPTSWVSNQTSVNSRKLKSYQASSVTTMP